MSDLKLFAGIHQALGRLCLVDGRARREIAEAAGINPSMLSGYSSGRLVPSPEHLDQLHAAADLLRPPSVKKAIEDVARVDARLRAEGERKGGKSPQRKEP